MQGVAKNYLGLICAEIALSSCLEGRRGRGIGEVWRKPLPIRDGTWEEAAPVDVGVGLRLDLYTAR